MSPMTRPLEGDDLPPLAALDRTYSERHGVEELLDRSVVGFYARSAHAFVRDDGSDLRGFVLAHAVWDGGRPVVRVSRLVAEGDDAATFAGLLEAVVKSAYDAGVYDLVADAPDGDAAGMAALEEATFEPRPVVSFGRTLGSRSRGNDGSAAGSA